MTRTNKLKPLGKSVRRTLWLPRTSGVGATAHLVSAMPWPTQKELERKARVLMDRTFERAVPGRERPRAIVTIGVMGSGKSTAVMQIARGWSPAVVDPDSVAVDFLGGRKLPGGGSLYDLAKKWTTRVFQHAIDGRYNIVYDSPVPSERILRALRRAGYSIEMLLVRASQRVARRREIDRDLARGWGRPGVSEGAHMSTARLISREGPKMAVRYANRLTVCDNTGNGMRCRGVGDPRKQSELALAQFFRE